MALVKIKEDKLAVKRGQTFGNWTVIERVSDYISPKGQHQIRWKCRCVCGKEKLVMQKNLIGGISTSCTCKRRIDLRGKTFGEWTVIERADDYVGNSGKHQSRWECRCSCGSVRIIAQSSLKNGKSKSCGHNYKLVF